MAQQVVESLLKKLFPQEVRDGRTATDVWIEDVEYHHDFDTGWHGLQPKNQRELFDLFWAVETRNEAMQALERHPELKAWYQRRAASETSSEGACPPTGEPPPVAKSREPALCQVKLQLLHFDQMSYDYFTSENARQDCAVIVVAGKKLLEGRKHTCSEGVEQYPLIESTAKRDSRGPFHFDPQMGLMELVAVREDGASCFPPEWTATVAQQSLHHVPPSAPQHEGLQQMVTIEEWLPKVYQKAKRPGAASILQSLKKEGLHSLERLMELPEKYFDALHGIPRDDMQFLAEQRELWQRPTTKSSFCSQEQHTVEQGAKLHQVRRYFYHLADQPRALSSLDAQVVRQAMELLKKGYKNTKVVHQLQREFLRPFYLRDGTNLPRGLLLWGPPGTGKTKLIEAITAWCGLKAVEPILMGSELNKSLVGQSEQLIKDLCRRALYMPHLPCVLVLDEVDSAMPKRNENGGGNQHGADKVSTFLGLISGGIDVPNLALIGTTNLPESIDEAIRRRMPIKVYVDIPDYMNRRALLVQELRDKEWPSLVQRDPSGRMMEPRDFFSEGLIDEATRLTMNFSGAAVKELCQLLRDEWQEYYQGHSLDFDAVEFCKPEGEVKKSGQYKALLRWLDSVSETFKLKIGSMTMAQMLNVKVQLTTHDHRTAMYRHELITRATGKMIIRPSQGLTFQVETYVKAGAESDDDEAGLGTSTAAELIYDLTTVDFFMRPHCKDCGKYALQYCKEKTQDGNRFHFHHAGGLKFNLKGLFERLTDPSLEELYQKEYREESGQVLYNRVEITVDHILREVSELVRIRMLNRIIYAGLSKYLMNELVTDEKAILEKFLSDVKQAQAPMSRAFLVIDLDSLVGMNYSESQGSMSSQSNSVRSSLLLDAAVEAFMGFRSSFEVGAAEIRPSNPDINKEEQWCLMIIRDENLMWRVREKTQWELSAWEKEEQKARELEMEVVKCLRCGEEYREADQKDPPGKCSYHPFPLVHVVWDKKGHDLDCSVTNVEVGEALRILQLCKESQTSEEVYYQCSKQGPEAKGCRAIRHCSQAAFKGKETAEEPRFVPLSEP